MTRPVIDGPSLLEHGDRVVERGLALGADEVEVAAVFAVGSSVTLEKNDLNIAISDDEMTFGVRVIKERRLGFATSNDPDTVDDTIRDALAIAEASLPDPHHELPRVAPAEPVPGLYDPAIEQLGVADMTALGAEILQRVRERDARASVDSGSVSATCADFAVVSSAGARAAERSSAVSCSVFGMAVDGEAVGSFVVEATAQRTRDAFASRVHTCADRFVDKAIGALDPTAGESYRGLVLFTPEATSSLLVGNLTGMMSSAVIRKGKSPLAGKLGEDIASPAMTLVDDATVAGAIGSSSFDREAVPHRPLTLVDRGRFAAIPYNHYEALAAGWEPGSTGSAVGGAASLPGVGMARLAMSPGEAALEDIVRDAGRCVLVTRFSGSTNSVTGEFSGVVKAGFLLDGGERRPISETLVAGNLLDVYRNIVAVSRETELVYGRTSMPYVLADGISVTAG